jgi:hypothetical protein
MWNVMDMWVACKICVVSFLYFFPYNHVQSCLEWLNSNFFFFKIYVLWLSWWLYSSAKCFHSAIQVGLLKMETWWHCYPPMGYIFVICLKVLLGVIWTFTSTPQLKLMIAQCVAHVKGPWLLPLMWNVFLTKYSNERTSKIELFDDLKISGVFPLSPIRELVVTMKFSKFKRMLEILLCLNILKYFFLNFFGF